MKCSHAEGERGFYTRFWYRSGIFKCRSGRVVFRWMVIPSLAIYEGGVMTNFANVALLADVKEGELLLAEVDGASICLTRVDGTVYAFSNNCSHEGGPLHDGYLEDYVVVCPWHSAEFDIQTGKIL